MNRNFCETNKKPLFTTIWDKSKSEEEHFTLGTVNKKIEKLSPSHEKRLARTYSNDIRGMLRHDWNCFEENVRDDISEMNHENVFPLSA